MEKLYKLQNDDIFTVPLDYFLEKLVLNESFQMVEWPKSIRVYKNIKIFNHVFRIPTFKKRQVIKLQYIEKDKE